MRMMLWAYKRKVENHVSATYPILDEVLKGIMSVYFYVLFIFLSCVVLHYNVNILLMWIMKSGKL